MPGAAGHDLRNSVNALPALVDLLRVEIAETIEGLGAAVPTSLAELLDDLAEVAASIRAAVVAPSPDPGGASAP